MLRAEPLVDRGATVYGDASGRFRVRRIACSAGRRTSRRGLPPGQLGVSLRRWPAPQKKTPRSESGAPRGGGGGSRTRVQTRNPKAFYTLIRHLVLLPESGRRPPNPGPSPFIFARRPGLAVRYLRMNDTPYGKSL